MRSLETSIGFLQLKQGFSDDGSDDIVELRFRKVKMEENNNNLNIKIKGGI